MIPRASSVAAPPALETFNKRVMPSPKRLNTTQLPSGVQEG
jgi:hypothetical protein